MQLSITIDLGNEAMQTPAEAAYAITRALAEFGSLGFETGGKIQIRDENGNTVGRAEVA